MYCITAALLLTARVSSGQRVTETSVPLGMVLDHGLEQSALTRAPRKVWTSTLCRRVKPGGSPGKRPNRARRCMQPKAR